MLIFSVRTHFGSRSRACASSLHSFRRGYIRHTPHSHLQLLARLLVKTMNMMIKTMTCVILTWSFLSVQAAEPQCIADASGKSNCQDTTPQGKGHDASSLLQKAVDVNVALQGSDNAEQIDMELLDKAGTGKVVSDNSDEVHHRSDAMCVAARLGMSVYAGNKVMEAMGLSMYVPPAPSDYTVVETYLASTVAGDVDKAVLFEKDGSCWLAFQGADSTKDFVNIHNYTVIEKWGMQLHSGLVAELVPLLEEMDFDQMRSVCTGPLTLIGHSLGGGLAQIAAMALNKQGDPLGANLTVDRLYTFGAHSVTATEQGNDKSADGCFEGESYWYTQPAASGGLLVDTVQRPLYGGGTTHTPTQTSKHFVFGNGSMIDFPCGTPLATENSLFDALSPLAAAVPHMQYLGFVGCI